MLIKITALTNEGLKALEEHKKEELQLRKKLSKIPKFLKNEKQILFENSKSTFDDSSHTFEGANIDFELEVALLENINIFFTKKKLIQNIDYKIEVFR